MKMTFRLLIAAAASWAFMTSTTSATGLAIVLHQVSGKIMLANTTGVAKAEQGTELHFGDKIFVGEDASASIRHGACLIRISEGTVFSIPQKAPCLEGKTEFAVKAHLQIIEPAADLEPENQGEEIVVAAPPPPAAVAAGAGVSGGLLVGVGIGTVAVLGFVGMVLSEESDPLSSN